MAVVHPDAVAIIPGPALHDVVGVVRLRHLVVGIDDHLGESQVRAGPASATLHPRPGCDAETRPASRAGLSSRDRAGVAGAVFSEQGGGAGLAREEAGEAEGGPRGDLHAPHTNTHTLPRGSLQLGPGIVTESGVDMYILKMDHQQGPTVQHRQLCPMVHGSLAGSGVWGEWIHVYVWLSPLAVQLKL